MADYYSHSEEDKQPSLLLFGETCADALQIKEYLANPSAFAAAAPAAGASAAAEEAPAAAKEEEKEESDDDMGFGLFD